MLKRPAQANLPLPSATVLVVDDIACARILVSSTLAQLGFTTLIAADGESALLSIRDFHPDALVTDLDMPGMNGESLIKALRTSQNPILREMPIIVCSSKADHEMQEELVRLGANALVPKPVDVCLLAETALRLF